MPKRCSHKECNTKINLLYFTCKCENSFCLKHKDPESHNCEYDFKEIKNLDVLIEEAKCVSVKIKSI